MTLQVEREQMNVVIVGHVDHGKSTLIGRMLVDTGTLPEGKLDQVKANCVRNAKPFEYAFLLDALKDEQSQGITIDTARSFFKSDLRDYIIIDAPGHIEFLKNMITGASRAEAAMLLIDANEGIKENSKRHGYMMSFLGIQNITVCINKMDLVGYDEEKFNAIKKEYTSFLKEINVVPNNFVPVSAREGDNIITLSKNMNWYKGKTILESFDSFTKAVSNLKQATRMPVQDIYKFTKLGDERRIFSGRVESGSFQDGDEIIFCPSNKKSKIKSIEGFNVKKQTKALAGQSTGFQLETQVYIKPGEIMCRVGEKLPHISSKLKVNIFWMGKQAFVKGKDYKLKLATQQIPVNLLEISGVLDASELSSVDNKEQIERHDVAECVLEVIKPIAFDDVKSIEATGRFVIVDNYEIVGGGVVLSPVFEEESLIKKHIQYREMAWERSDITPVKRAYKNEHKAVFLVLVGDKGTGKIKIAKLLEEELFKKGKFVYFLGLSNTLLTHSVSNQDKVLGRHGYLKQLGEMAHIMTDAGLILMTSISDAEDHEIAMIKRLNHPSQTLIVNFDENSLCEDHIDLILDNSLDDKGKVQSIIDLVIKTTELDPEYFL